ncbi:enoyl-CoA hydratase [Variovorax paradoxus]|jgi:2-(1,2-epoxy-1,2-dihydrophenyl)acetyl-CoA isomerase|uniref:enoyl-CoA hydratase/isomerase family protein n=1 Tax=Variovorax paradoxus TaxID=34073 RepID=UPI0006E6DCC7|nr:enoyl-CoA hydratase [Variovorax paradoxus]KPV11257.1 enoyl-CoA hydratase [Variovorax paradoxus]KPV13165.1 enoyl-CoA hydratase [Variovorax paradoxus]KPV19568.1 enoyl-CoA hydratase [Variovorax paradoxus]KPV28025.1 enoyl-CoA hydratase [Variovorax paradoxus]
MKTLDYRLDDGVATLTLDRPEAKNALDPTMADELGECLAAIRADESVRVLVLTGAGGAFCAGGDVKAMGQGGPRTPEQRRAGMARYTRICTELMALDRPVIAAVDGVAYGAGFSLALMCDIVLLSERARLCMVFQRIGLVPDMGAFYTLPRVVGLQRAKELIFSAREIDAAEALRLGLAMEVLPAEALAARAQAIARSFAGASPVAMSIAKRALQASLGSDLQTLLEIESSGQALASNSDYAKEAVRRFAAREPAQFRWPPAA